tara:strand:- start:84 stop:428 length:345 start_codon:yes stop_codon:yes gene_type:complete
MSITNIDYETLDLLINLKFKLNSSINDIYEIIDNINLDYLNNDTLLKKIILNSRENKLQDSNLFLNNYKELYNNIDQILFKNCLHEWIEDVVDEPIDISKNICYCKHCFIYKKK